ncbi:MAG: hypothetical protein CL555_12545 [Algoriphagus sp.]|nr:hypothetical protein [Algoriphagus sp.]
MEQIVFQFLKRLKIPISSQYVETFLLTHPEFPSLLSVSDLLENLKLVHSIKRINREEIESLESPCLILPERSAKGLISVLTSTNLRKLKSEIASQSLIVISVNPSLINSTNQQKSDFFQEKIKNGAEGLLKITLIVLLGLFLFSIDSIFDFFWVMTSIFGAVVSYLIFSKDLGFKFDVIDKFCNSGKKASCDEMLQSEKSIVFGFLKFSDLIISLFVFQLVILGLFVLSDRSINEVWPLFMGIALLSIPAVLYSVYLQYAVLKTWCKLCLIVSAILILQFGMLIGNFFDETIYWGVEDLLGTILLAISYPIILSLTFLVRSRTQEFNTFYQRAVHSERIKNSPKVFYDLLKQQNKAHYSPLYHELVIGNPNAPIKLIIVSNLYCAPCKVQHEEVSRLVESNKEYLSVSMRFVKINKQFNKDISSTQYLLQYWWDNIHNTEKESSLTEQLIHSWFSEMNVESFASSHPLKELKLSNEVKAMAELQEKWIEEIGVSKTPTIFINDYELPSLYTIADLHRILPDLAEYYFLENQHSNLKS